MATVPEVSHELPSEVGDGSGGGIGSSVAVSATNTRDGGGDAFTGIESGMAESARYAQSANGVPFVAACSLFAASYGKASCEACIGAANGACQAAWAAFSNQCEVAYLCGTSADEVDRVVHMRDHVIHRETEPQTNVCISGSQCRIDADCGPGGYCSPGAEYGS
jgi:hypothetical protein